MITLFLSMSLLFIAVSSSVATCADQQVCIKIEIQDPVDPQGQCNADGKCIDICVTHDCKPDEGSSAHISHACPNVPDQKWEPWHDSRPPPDALCFPHTEENPGAATSCMCHFNVDCKRDAAQEDRWVEFAVKDGPSCGLQGDVLDTTEPMKLSMDDEDKPYVYEVECRVADNEECDPQSDPDCECDPDCRDVKCENALHDECIHKIYYQCPTPDPIPTSPEDSKEGGPVDTCEKQSKCIDITVEDDGDATYKVCLNFVGGDECIKDDDLSYVEQCTSDPPPDKDEGFALDDEMCLYNVPPCTDVVFNVKDGNCHGDVATPHEATFGDHTAYCTPKQGNGCEDKDAPPGKGPKGKGKGLSKEEKQHGPCQWTIETPDSDGGACPAPGFAPGGAAAANAKDSTSDKNGLLGIDSNGNVSAGMFIVLGGIVGCVLLIALGAFIYFKVFKSKKEKIAKEEVADMAVIVEENENGNEKDEEVAVTRTTA